MKNTRTVTYRRAGTPAVILEGKWLEKKLGWKMGDQIEIVFKENNKVELGKIEK